MSSTEKTTVKPASVIRDELIGEMAAILYDIAPPDAQRIIARKMDELSWAVQRESQSG